MNRLHATYEVTREELIASVADPLDIKEYDLRARVQQMALERIPITVVREEGLQPDTVRLHVSAPDPEWLIAEIERLREALRYCRDLSNDPHVYSYAREALEANDA